MYQGLVSAPSPDALVVGGRITQPSHSLRPSQGAGWTNRVTFLTHVFLISVAILILVPPTSPVQAAPPLQPPFPRLASIYAKPDENSCEGKQRLAKFNLIVSDFNWWSDRNYSPCVPSGATFGSYLKTLNPSLVSLLYFHSTVFEDGDWSWRPGTSGYVINGQTYYIDLRWFMTLAGSVLTANISASATSIPVADLTNYSPGDHLIVGGAAGQSWPEMLVVTGKSGSSGPGTLSVTRGLNAQNGKFPAASHNTGDFVRPVAYAFGNPGIMIMNVTSASFVSNINPAFGNQTWQQFVVSFLALKMSEPELQDADGYFLDNFVDHAIQIVTNYTKVDLTNTNQPSGVSDVLWNTGLRNLAAGLRARLPGKVIVGNTGGDAATEGIYLNGGMIEGVDQNGSNSFVGDPQNGYSVLPYYDSWMNTSASPTTFLFDAGTQGVSLDQMQTNYQAVRFLLALALSRDGYFIYDDYFNSANHATDWWYDEYDNAGQGTGYLGQALGAATQPLAGVYRREFTNGLSLANTTNSVQTLPLGGTYRKIHGTQAPAVNDGSLVSSVTLQPKDGIILLRDTASQAPTPTPLPSTMTTGYLSDQSWVSALNGWGPVERNMSNGGSAAGDGRTLTMNGVTYAKGLGTNSYSAITYQPAGQCSSFTASVGIDDEVGANGSVVFQIYADGTKLFESGVLRGGGPIQNVNINIAGRQQLVLYVLDAGDGGWLDHADWANPYITCAGGNNPPTPTPTGLPFPAPTGPAPSNDPPPPAGGSPPGRYVVFVPAA
jgi:hypothetical protein